MRGLVRSLSVVSLVVGLFAADAARATERPSIVEVLPFAERLYREQGLIDLDRDQILREISRVYPTFAISDAEVSLRTPDELSLLYGMVTALQEIDRRQPLEGTQLAGLVKLGVNLHALGQRWQDDAAFRRLIDQWKDVAPSESVLVLLVELELSLERTLAYTQGWLPGVIERASKFAGRDPAMDMNIARWHLSQGAPERAVTLLLATGPGERSVAFGLTMYHAMLEAGRADEAAAVRADILANLPGASGSLQRIDDAFAAKQAEAVFAADPAAQPLADWIAHTDRRLQQNKLDDAALLLQGIIQAFPDEPRAYAYVARVLLAWRDLDAAEVVLNQAFDRELSTTSLDQARLSGGIAAKMQGAVAGSGAPFTDVDVDAGLDGLHKLDRKSGKRVAAGVRVLLRDAARRRVDPEDPGQAVAADLALRDEALAFGRKHRKDAVALLGSAAVLSGWDHDDLAAQVLAKGVKRAPAADRGRLKLAQARVALIRAVRSGSRDGVGVLADVPSWLDEAERRGVPAHEVGLERLWLEIASASLGSDDWPAPEVVRDWIDRLVDLDRSLDPSQAGDRERSSAVSLSVAALAMHLNEGGQAEASLTQARSIDVDPGMTHLATGQLRAFIGDAPGAMAQLNDARRIGGDARWVFLVDKWLMLAASRMGDRATFRDAAAELLAVWDAAGMPDVVKNDSPVLLTRGSVGFAFSAPLDGLLTLQASMDPTLVVVHGMPHDRSVIEQLAGGR